MTVILNVLMCFMSFCISINSIIKDEPNIISIVISTVFLINVIMLIKKNRENYILSNNYYSFICTVSELLKNNDLDKLTEFLHKSRNTNFYKYYDKENSDMPIVIDILQKHNYDKFDK